MATEVEVAELPLCDFCDDLAGMDASAPSTVSATFTDSTHPDQTDTTRRTDMSESIFANHYDGPHAEPRPKTYRIVRMYFDDTVPSQVMKRFVTLEEAQAWCQDPETSSSTATSAKARHLTAAYGQWFDGFEEE